MKTWLVRTLVVATLLGAACAPAAAPPPPTAAPAKPTAAPAPTTAPAAAKPTTAAKPAAATTAPAAKPTEAPKPAAAPTTAAKPAATTAPAAKPTATGATNPQPVSAAEWDQIVAAAKREGRISVFGPAGDGMQEVLATAFMKAYPEIQVEFEGASGSQLAPKVIGTINANLFTYDVLVAGTTTGTESLMPANAVVPMGPYLVGPNASDASKWKDGKLDFADRANEYIVCWVERVQIPFIINPTMVQIGEIKSWKDLLDPKWKGQMSMRNPSRAGAGLGHVLFWMTEIEGGRQFAIDLLSKQEIVFSNDDRQMLDWTAQGRYPISIGPSGTQAWEMKESGLPLELYPSSALAEGSYVTTSNGAAMVARNAPHPNAVKVYMDWLLSKEGQTIWSQVNGHPSRRLDVPTDHLESHLVPEPGVRYQLNHKQEYNDMANEVIELVKSAAPGL
jgi:iron(III) transport system substrate-binding protein